MEEIKEDLECKGKCGMSYCDDNGCVDRKRNLVEEDLIEEPNNE